MCGDYAHSFIRPSVRDLMSATTLFNPLNIELNPICHLLALLRACHILHVSRIRVKIKLDEKNVFMENCRTRVSFMKVESVAVLLYSRAF
jgi:hypothetical protein